MSMSTKARAGLIAGSAVAALALTGLVGSAVANAADSTPSPSTGSSQSAAPDATRGGDHVAEEALTGTDADKVQAAVEATYPDATIDRMEKDSDGRSVYEAHITKADGTHVTVLLDGSFAITGEDAFGGGRGPGGPGGQHGPDGADGDAASPSTTTAG
jgi:hypothetical protein